ncbi:MAG TPA: sigma-70 family RNA polymerase sigma factor [Galbitalea sp.]|jgi:RNA polymerase sigma factor (sigma-70 family)|nr:sigma-70 family RNA polymerase sigma factor [Galbitalea sp.]
MNSLLHTDYIDTYDSCSDESLVEQSRNGDSRAFAELWLRHADAAVHAAKRFTSIDAEDLVSEAYTRIFRALLNGGGPDGPFRPYLYVTVRNIASRWGRKATDVNIDDIDDIEDPGSTVDGSLAALDLTLTAIAFARLPERWRSVLWYTEVRQMNPQDVAPMLGMTPNSVAALSYRAREGLRKEWLQAHIKESGAVGDCRWTLSRAGDYASGGLSARTRRKIKHHLRGCPKCSLIVQEVDHVRSGLAMALIPAIVGGGIGGGALLASLAPAGVASAAGVASWFAAPAAIAGVLALTVGLSGAVAPTTPNVHHVAPPAASAPLNTSPAVLSSPGSKLVVLPAPIGGGSSSGAGDHGAGGGDSGTSGGAGGTGNAGSGGTGSGGTGSSGSGSSTTGSTSGSLVNIDLNLGGGTSTPPTAPAGVVGASVSLNLSGTGTPGAQVALQALGIIYASTTIGANGIFTLSLQALPHGVASLQLVQTVNRNYLLGLIPTSALGQLLGSVTGLVDALVKPLRLTSGGASGVSISLIN